MAYHMPAERGPAQREQSTEAKTSSISGNQILELQRLAGNQAVVGHLTRRGMLPVQRFGAKEHLRLGDGNMPRDKSVMLTLAPGYQITRGEMIAMAGDCFESLEQMRELAAKPGPGAGTREEIEYMRLVGIRGEGSKDDFSDEAIEAADRRYYQLAANNRSHFLNPEGQPGTTADRAEGAHYETRAKFDGTRITYLQELVIPRAGAGYRHYHSDAVFQAWLAGLEGRDLEEAIVPEAFGLHYLTDAFSSGHVRTARSAIQEYWNPRVPMFLHNLKGWLAEQMAKRIGDNTWWMTRELAMDGLGPDNPGAFQQVSELIDKKAAFTFGDIVSLVVHDYDNVTGVEADVNGKRMRLYGDGMLGVGETEEIIKEAIGVSRHDLTVAWRIGQRKADVAEVLPAVTKDGLYTAEHMLPNPVADDKLKGSDKSIQWKVDSTEELLADKKFFEGLKVFAKEKVGELAGAASDLAEDVQPHFKAGILEPFENKPLWVLKNILNWTPDTGGGLFHREEDNNAMEYYQKASGMNAVDKLTVQQRVRLIGHLSEGMVYGDEREAAWDLLTANPAHSDAVIAKIGRTTMEGMFGSQFRQRFPTAS